MSGFGAATQDLERAGPDQRQGLIAKTAPARPGPSGRWRLDVVAVIALLACCAVATISVVALRRMTSSKTASSVACGSSSGLQDCRRTSVTLHGTQLSKASPSPDAEDSEEKQSSSTQALVLAIVIDGLSFNQLQAHKAIKKAVVQGVRSETAHQAGHGVTADGVLVTMVKVSKESVRVVITINLPIDAGASEMKGRLIDGNAEALRTAIHKAVASTPDIERAAPGSLAVGKCAAEVRTIASTSGQASGDRQFEETSLTALLEEQQTALLCHLKEAAGSRFLAEPPLPMAESCAVVSHSGGLLYREMGKEIDSHERVMRFNENHVNGYQKHVGSKTDVRFSGVMHGMKDNEIGDLIVRRVCDPDPCVNESGRPVQHIQGPTANKDPALGKIMAKLYPSRAGQNETPALDLTSGFSGMLIALSSCRAVHGFEMTPSDLALKCGHYAYDAGYQLGTDENSWHGYFTAEHDLWARLSVDDGLRCREGRIVIPGFSAVNCDGTLPALNSLSMTEVEAERCSADSVASCHRP